MSVAINDSKNYNYNKSATIGKLSNNAKYSVATSELKKWLGIPQDENISKIYLGDLYAAPNEQPLFTFVLTEKAAAEDENVDAASK